MVVVVGRVVEAVPPHGRPGGWLYQSAVAPDQSGIEESPDKYEEHLATICSWSVVLSLSSHYIPVKLSHYNPLHLSENVQFTQVPLVN